MQPIGPIDSMDDNKNSANNDINIENAMELHSPSATFLCCHIIQCWCILDQDMGYQRTMTSHTGYHQMGCWPTMALMSSVVQWNMQCTKQKYNQYAEMYLGGCNNHTWGANASVKGFLFTNSSETVNGSLVGYLSAKVRDIPIKTKEM